jgi:hypothetical protein
MAFNFAFIFVTADADAAKHRSVVETPTVKCTTVAVRNYAEAEEVAKQLLVEGVMAFELCGGFGHAGTARIAQAVSGKAFVGSVRFDSHPHLDCQSGDTRFG